MNIIDGKKIADKIISDLEREVKDRSIKPCLGVVLVGNDTASHIYIKKKEQAAEKIGIKEKTCFI